jgi:hypothetical protein
MRTLPSQAGDLTLFPAGAAGEERRLAAVLACFGRCVCAGQCGRSHQNWPEMGRCGSEEGAAPLQAVPALLAGTNGEPGDLVAVCARCPRGITRQQAVAQPAPPAPSHLDELTLFATCPVTGCKNLVGDPGEVCAECLQVFGPYLRPARDTSPAGELTAAAARSEAQAAEVLAARRELAALGATTVAVADEWRNNQQCGCCEERRTCHIDPASPNGWICKSCEATR